MTGLGYDKKFTVPTDVEPIPLKSIMYDNGVAIAEGTKVEVIRMKKLELLQYAIVGKFVQGWPKLDDL